MQRFPEASESVELKSSKLPTAESIARSGKSITSENRSQRVSSILDSEVGINIGDIEHILNQVEAIHDIKALAIERKGVLYVGEGIQVNLSLGPGSQRPEFIA